MKQVHLRMDDELYNELLNCSDMAGQTMQDCVREAVIYYISSRRKSKKREEFGIGEELLTCWILGSRQSHSYFSDPWSPRWIVQTQP